MIKKSEIALQLLNTATALLSEDAMPAHTASSAPSTPAKRRGRPPKADAPSSAAPVTPFPAVSATQAPPSATRIEVVKGELVELPAEITSEAPAMAPKKRGRPKKVVTQ